MPKNIAVTFFENDELTSTLAVPRRTTLEALRQRWREASPDSGPAIFLLESLDGAPLPEEGSLEQLVPPQKGVLAIHVLLEEEKQLRVLGSTLDPVGIRLLPQEDTEALTRRVKDLIGLEEGRVVRLLCGGCALAADVLPSVQLAGCPFLDVDLQLTFRACLIESGSFHPVVCDHLERVLLNKDLPEAARREVAGPTDPWAVPAFAKAGEVRTLSAFASEPARALAGAEWRAIAWGSGVCAAGDEPVGGLLSDEALLSGAVSGVVLEREMKIRVDEKLRRRSYTAAVWPSYQLGHFLTNIDDCVLIDGEPADPCQFFWRAGLQAGSCLSVTKRISLSVVSERGVTRQVTADLGESLFDLRERLDLVGDVFEVWSGDQVLRDDCRLLADLNLDVTSVLVARPRTRIVHLQLGRAEPVCIGAVAKSITFRAFLEAASAAVETELPRKTRFVCQCGRVFSDESAERRELPLHCCRALDLHLSVEQPAKDKTNQTAWKTREASSEAETTTCEVNTQTQGTQREATAQAGPAVDRATAQAGPAVDRATAQAGPAVDRATAQAGHSFDCGTGGVGEPPRIAKFFVRWRFDGRSHFDLEPFRGAVRGGELRAAIAEARGVAAADLQLRQWRARRQLGGAALVDVGLAGVLEFADAQGEEVPGGERRAERQYSIGDGEAVPAAGPLRAVIYVDRA